MSISRETFATASACSTDPMIRTIRIDGVLVPDGVNARMKRLLKVEAKIQQTEDRKALKLLNCLWAVDWFWLHPRNETGAGVSPGDGRAANTTR